MKKAIKIILELLISCIVLFIILTWPWERYYYNTNPYWDTQTMNDARIIIGKERFIIHAVGVVNDNDHSDLDNNRNMLITAYGHGHRIVEMDFIRTDDGEIVCDQDWTVSLSDIAQFMKANDDLYIITDVQDSNNYFCMKLAKEYPELMDRFIIQIYSPEEFDDIYFMGCHSIIYTLRSNPTQNPDLHFMKNFAKVHPLVGVAIGRSQANDAQLLKGMKKIGVPLYMYEISDGEDTDSYLSKGIAAIYRDNDDGEK